MNNDTVNLIERPYLEIVDDVLTSIVGGVVNEPILFDLKNDLYALAQPAREIRGITGTTLRDGKPEHYVFQKEIDYLFSEGDNAVVWQPKGALPADDSVFYVDYFRKSSQSPLTDINVGSVTRTLSEAVGREIATVYQQINLAYLAGFVDTANGKALELVVAILGIERKTKDYAAGNVTFFRNPAVSGAITIGEGLVLATTKGDASFETTQPRTLQQGQVRIDAPIRASAKFKGDAGKVAAGAITQLVQPIAGIERVTNFDATFLGSEDESDEDLRIRAKAIIRSVSKGTLAALSRVILEERANLLEIWDPNGQTTNQSDPGKVVLLVETEPERFASLRAVVEQTRAAGIQTTLIARYIFFKPRLVVSIRAGLAAAGKTKLVQQIIDSLQAYVDKLGSAEPAEGKQLLKAVTAVSDVKTAKFADVIAWYSNVGQAAAASLVDAIVQALEAAPAGDTNAIRTVVSSVVNNTQPALLPTSQRTLDRSLVQGPSGSPATDEELESGDFKVVASRDNQKWWVVLDMEAADILLREEGS
jgi:hypothetical protein